MATTTTHHHARPRPFPSPADPVAAAEEAADPRRLTLAQLYREEGRLRLLLLAGRRPGPATLLRLAGVVAALDGGAR